MTGSASRLVADLGPEAVRIIAETFALLVTGQMRETKGAEDGDDAVSHYLKVVSEKTACLIAAAGRFGGTFSGASQVLREDWIPLWVRPQADPESGNAALIEAGGLALTAEAAMVDPTALPTPPRTGSGVMGVPDAVPTAGADTLYEAFLTQAVVLCGERARTAAELATALGLVHEQLELWLSCAVAEGRLRSRPDSVLFELPRSSLGQLTLFDDA